MMNRTIKMLTAALLTTAVLGSSGLVLAAETNLGAKAAALDKSYTLADMLTYALEDEYLAKAEYAAIIAEFDAARPYTNIIKAEANHIAELLPLFSAYKVTVPVVDAASHAIVPATLAETYAIGVEAEKDNIAMYEAFLKQDLPADVRVVFENLRNASVRHLAAFTRWDNGGQAGSSIGTGNRGNSENTGNRGNSVNSENRGNSVNSSNSGWGNGNRRNQNAGDTCSGQA